VPPPDAVSRLDEVGRRFELPEDAVAALRAVLALQADDPTASTTVRDPDAAADRHVADSLVALELSAVCAARLIADLGSGAGWPGLALAAALPAAHVTLVESAARHCRYLERAVAASGLRNVDIAHARVEEWEAGGGEHDLVTARALAALPAVVEYAAPLLADAGHLVAWKGEVGDDEARDGAAAAQSVGLEAVEVRRVDPYPGAGRRTLHVFRKVAPTPSRFPRRPGMAVKRPLGAGSGRGAR
jgi:16S rRNA (guanine527-N7)-methyltransferase